MANTTNFGWETPDDTDLVKDGALAMRTLGNAIDTSLVDLKGGTSGQILAKNSNTDMDFIWIANDQGDITAVTAGTGISGGGTSGAVTITNTVATTFDAAGDLLVGTGSDTWKRLAIGTAGQILKVNSGATDLEWGAAGGASFVGVSVKKTGNQSINNATDTILTFDSENYDTDGFHDNSTNNSRLTIPSGKGGKYLFTGYISFDANTTGVRAANIIRNGGGGGNRWDPVAIAPSPTAGIGTTPSFSLAIDASAGDYFELRVYQASGGALNVGADTYFQATYLGA